MQAPTFYGGEVEMLALSDALQVSSLFARTQVRTYGYPLKCRRRAQKASMHTCISLAKLN